MNLLPFDQTFGDIVGGATGQVQGDGGRYVDIVGTMEKSAYLQGLIPLATLAQSYIRPQFVNGGWSIQGIDLTWDGSRYHFRITAWVRNQHSDAEIRNGARSTLLAVKMGAVGQQAFSNVYVELQQPNTSVGGNTGGIVTGGNTGGGSSGVNSFIDSFGSSLGSTLGVSTPIALLIGVGILIVILRK